MNYYRYSLFTVFFVLACISLSGCAPHSATMPQQDWTVIQGNENNADSIRQIINEFSEPGFGDEQFSLTSSPSLDQKFTNTISLTYNKTPAYASDSLEYVYNEESIMYELPYAAINNAKLSSPECADDSLYDTILCYMPRIDGLYGVFDNVFASGQQLVYTVSAYESLSQQHVLDLGSKTEFPLMSTLYLLYTTSNNDAVLATRRGTSSLYNGLLLFSDGTSTSLVDGPISSVFFDGKYVYVTSIDYTSELSSVDIITIDSGEVAASVKNVQLGERAEFIFSDTTNELFAYYVDVSFVEEKEFFYVTSIDTASSQNNWLVQINE